MDSTFYEPTPPPKSQTLSLVWLVPLVALIVSVWVAWKSYTDRGPLIEIFLEDAGGVEAGKTQVKHRDVKVGVVEKIGFSSDGAQVRILARMDKPIAPFLDDNAQFWVVQPEVTVQGIRGLDTVLSGSFIEASWDLTIGEPQSSFTALESPPLTPPDQPGRRVRLIAQDGGSMSVGAPVFYKRIEVGRIEAKQLTPDGEAVVFDIFVEAPHHRRLSTGSRFWSTSGFDIELGAEGAKVHVESLVSLLRGGIAFDTVAIGGPPLDDFQLFRLFENQKAARASIFEDSFGAQIRLSVVFEGSVRGLAQGAPVELRGYKVGEVVNVTADIGTGDTPEVSLVTEITLQPTRLGLPQGEPEQSLEFLKNLVRNGMRAKLANASLLTGALYVELVQEPDAEPAEIDETAVPYPRMPSVASDFDDLAASAEGVLNRINALPVEELLGSATTLMTSLNTLVSDESTMAVPGELNLLLADARGLLSNPALARAIEDAADTAAEAEKLVSAIGDPSLVADLKAALASAKLATQNIAAASAAAPVLIANLAETSGTVRELPLDELIAAATGVTEEARTFFASESTQALPGDLSRALAEVEFLLADLREADAAKTLANALEDAGAAAAAIREATAEAPATMQSIRAAADGALDTLEQTPSTVASIKALADSAKQVADKAAGLPLEVLVVEARGLLARLDGFAANNETQAVPASLNAALISVRTLVDELRAAETATRLATVLDEAARTAQSISATSNAVPETLRAIEAVSNRISTLPLDELVVSAKQLLNDIDSVVTAPGAREIPGATVAALDQVRSVVEKLAELQVPENFNTALVSFDVASRSFDVLSADLQAVLPGIQRVAGRADSVLSSLDIGSEINYEAITMIREIRDAARAITVLAATVERRPNSLILGK